MKGLDLSVLLAVCAIVLLAHGGLVDCWANNPFTQQRLFSVFCFALKSVISAALILLAVILFLAKKRKAKKAPSKQ